MARRFVRILTAVAVLSAGALAQDPVSSLPPASRWMDHLTKELLPFWDQPSAMGDPAGSFPSVRCNDGSLLNPQLPCPELNTSYLLANIQYTVPLSRQVYGYCVAYHMTGNTLYLDYARAGIDYLLANAFDWVNGGIAEQKDLDTGEWQPAAPYRDPQQIAYGLVGMAMYYYLTRDPEILSDINTVRTYIQTNYWNDDLGALQWWLADQPGTPAVQRQLVATLDQLNTHMAMIGRFVPEPVGSEWRATACLYAHSIINEFYNPHENLFFLAHNSPADYDLTQTTTDFGHNSKALWMILNSGRACSDPTLVDFTWKHAPALLARAWRDTPGTWAGNIGNQWPSTNSIDPTTDWWMHAELDQLSATLALQDHAYAGRLLRSYNYWLNYWVDPVYGEVWNTVDTTTNLSTNSMPKQWPWKNAYHSFEHTLVAYITTAALQNNSVPLYFAFESVPPADQIQPYFFSGTVTSNQSVPANGWSVQRITFSNVNVAFDAAPSKAPCASEGAKAAKRACQPGRLPVTQ
jgi:mannose/cellobiose epimerase-like protein (N-acyl-D-glucosamine 2-epimerase family)